MPPKKIGIKETKEAVTAMVVMVEAVDDAYEDKKFTIGDLWGFPKTLKAMAVGIRGINKIPAELADLDDAEVKELIDFVNVSLPIGKRDTRILVGHALKTALAFAQLLTFYRSMRKKKK